MCEEWRSGGAEECGELAVEGVKSCNNNDHGSKGGGEPEKAVLERVDPLLLGNSGFCEGRRLGL